MNLQTVTVLVLTVCGLCCVGCGKAKAPVVNDPHSAEGIMLRLQEQGKLLNDALGRKDFTYIHDYGYYFSGILQSFYSQLDEVEKQRLRGTIEELVTLSKQLDRAGGGRHVEATEATVQRVQLGLKELDKQFQEAKQRR